MDFSDDIDAVDTFDNQLIDAIEEGTSFIQSL